MTTSLKAQAAGSDHRNPGVAVSFRLRLYVLVFIATHLFSVVNRVQNILAPDSPSYFLYFMQALCEPLNGFANACVYGMNRMVINQYKQRFPELAAADGDDGPSGSGPGGGGADDPNSPRPGPRRRDAAEPAAARAGGGGAEDDDRLFVHFSPRTGAARAAGTPPSPRRRAGRRGGEGRRDPPGSESRTLGAADAAGRRDALKARRAGVRVDPGRLGWGRLPSAGDRSALGPQRPTGLSRIRIPGIWNVADGSDPERIDPDRERVLR